MLKSLAMLAMMLAVAQSNVPAVGSTPGERAQSGARLATQIRSTQQQIYGTNRSVEVTHFPAVSVRRDWRDSLNLTFSGILVLIGIGGVWYARKTLRTIQGQLDEIKVAGLQTDRMIKLAEGQATATATTAEAAEKAANAARISAESYQIAERAWMTFTEVVVGGFTNCTLDNNVERTDGTTFQFRWINAGNTPAMKCTLLTMNLMVNEIGGPVPIFTPPANVEQVSSSIIFPRVPAKSTPIAFRKIDIEKLKQRKCRIFIYGKADYQAVYPTTTPPYTEVCIEVEYGGTNNKTGETVFVFHMVGPQNSAT